LEQRVGAALDDVRDGVAVGRPRLQRLQDQEIQRPLEQVGVERGGRAARQAVSLLENPPDHKMIYWNNPRVNAGLSTDHDGSLDRCIDR
jgi:hypothetical protein